MHFENLPRKVFPRVLSFVFARPKAMANANKSDFALQTATLFTSTQDEMDYVHPAGVRLPFPFAFHVGSQSRSTELPPRSVSFGEDINWWPLVANRKMAWNNFGIGKSQFAYGQSEQNQAEKIQQRTKSFPKTWLKMNAWISAMRRGKGQSIQLKEKQERKNIFIWIV